MKIKAEGSEQFKLLDYVLPPLSDGRYRADISQTVKIGEGEEQTVETFHKETGFYVAGRAFTLQPDSVFAVYPAENEEGNFSNELPFMVLNLRSLPWQYSCQTQSPKPWVALIALSAEDMPVEKDMTVAELLASGKDREIFYPAQKQPKIYLEKPDECCHVVDIPVDTYLKIMPSMEEIPYLCHAKYVNLCKTPEEVSSMDGFFSVVIGNRFIPSKETEGAKCTLHLVSVLGYDSVEFSAYRTVRLCSLYHWHVFSQSTAEAGFGKRIRSMDSREFGGDRENGELAERGVVAKEHRFRTGETTASLYCSALVPGDAPALSMESRHTADGHLIYDSEKGIFDVSYASAWQLGRMITLSDDAMAFKIHDWRRRMAVKAHERLLRMHMADCGPDIPKLCKGMKEALCRGDKNETDDA